MSQNARLFTLSNSTSDLTKSLCLNMSLVAGKWNYYINSKVISYNNCITLYAPILFRVSLMAICGRHLAGLACILNRSEMDTKQSNLQSDLFWSTERSIRQSKGGQLIRPVAFFLVQVYQLSCVFYFYPTTSFIECNRLSFAWLN